MTLAGPFWTLHHGGTNSGPPDPRLKTTALTALMAVNMVLRALHASMYHVALPANQRKNDN